MCTVTKQPYIMECTPQEAVNIVEKFLSVINTFYDKYDTYITEEHTDFIDTAYWVLKSYTEVIKDSKSLTQEQRVAIKGHLKETNKYILGLQWQFDEQ